MYASAWVYNRVSVQMDWACEQVVNMLTVVSWFLEVGLSHSESLSNPEVISVVSIQIHLLHYTCFSMVFIFSMFCYYAAGCNLECFQESAASLQLRRYTPQGCLTSCGSTRTVAGLWALAWHDTSVLQNFEAKNMSAWKPCSCKFRKFGYSQLHKDLQANLAKWHETALRCSRYDLQILRGATEIWQAKPAASAAMLIVFQA